MADPPPPATLIAGQYAVDLARPLAGAGGGLTAFAAIDHRAHRPDLMAVQVQRRHPPRASAVLALTQPIEGMLTPLAHGPAPGPAGTAAWYVIAAAPPGPPLSARTRHWSEAELLEQVLRPAARALNLLVQRGITHRAIRPDNVFQGAPGRPVVLGMAWAAPPALHQPAIAEPPYSAMCLPAGRGDGSIGDDVYALGVLLLTLALGRVPLAGQDEATILRRKLELGSYAALAGEERLPPVIADLVRGMLAEDPEHRPSPLLLTEPTAARARRVAARPPRRAQRALQIGGRTVGNARVLGHALAVAPDQGLSALRDGVIDEWLRHQVGDAGLAARLDEAMHTPAPDASGDAVAVMRAVAVLDPLAPLCWRGVALWPDGLGPALAATDDPEKLIELTQMEATGLWARMRPERCDVIALQTEARRQRGWFTLRSGDGLERMLYALNPLLPCASPLVAAAWVARLTDLPAALEVAAGKVDRGKQRPIDRHIAPFIATRSDGRGAELAALAGSGAGTAMADLRLLAGLQLRFHPAPLPNLAAWVAARPDELLSGWRGRERREQMAGRLAKLAETGQLVSMLRLVQDPAEQAADLRASRAVAAELAGIDRELSDLASATSLRAEQARRWGQELAAGLGLAAVAAAMLAAVLG